MSDIYNLQRFVEAQNQVYEEVLHELGTGQKLGHWMWYIFPQIKGLGLSTVAQRFAISCQQEAEAYLEHSVLGARLRQCTQLVINVERRSVEQIFYYPDNLKFGSSMTLFINATTDNQIFKDALQKYFEGEPDQLTLGILKINEIASRK
jgi:uncharacterized protein (DUF1810 family)